MASVVSVAGNLLLIPWLGVPGVAYTAVTANLIISVVFIRRMQSEYGTMGLISLVIKTVISCFVMGFAAWFLARFSLPAAIGAGVAIYTVLQLVLRTLTPEEYALTSTILTSPFRKMP
jgi:peptidoglycan biosynthesis protein MviN/MurJ (putative lipid II flippase)